VLADPGPETMFDDRVYKRGALTLHALRVHLGDEPFWSLLHTWVSLHQHGSVSTADFVRHVTALDPSGEAQRLLESWLMHPALPLLPRPARR
jgi:aminopeptidase